MRVKAEYCQAVDQCVTDSATGIARLTAVFAEDIVCDYGESVLHGRGDATAFLGDLGNSRDWLWHSIQTPNIAIDGMSAEASWTIVAMMREKGGSRTDSAIGRYHDHLRRRTDGSWEIARIRWVSEHLLSH
ncbi:hypothetical protein FHS92_002960 [Sphingobium subterraneum]|uniref:SnoaL-like domain-containing protein n=2 Tax=Sphingobium subterraneum TaxID=627688 RepID=A0A841J2M0_9SPHN|nr:hypothetical protein [Sphingobium subterraneum]